jgi:hypothetical protein
MMTQASTTTPYSEQNYLNKPSHSALAACYSIMWLRNKKEDVWNHERRIFDCPLHSSR